MNKANDVLPEGIRIIPVRAFSDNYIWCIHNNNELVVVDPGDATPVLAFCKQHNLTLNTILVTHHHQDHTGGIAQLTSAFPDVSVIGPGNSNIRGITKAVIQGDAVHLSAINCEFAVINVSGHTLDHIAFYGHNVVFCGDTLFAAGCGRLFEGSPAQMLHSLTHLKCLPDSTQVYCAHEYTQSNIAFAKAVEPNNPELQHFSDEVNELRKADTPSLPSSIKIEKAINPFLRTHIANVHAAAESFSGESLSDETAVFAAIRRWKDEF